VKQGKWSQDSDQRLSSWITDSGGSDYDYLVCYRLARPGRLWVLHQDWTQTEVFFGAFRWDLNSSSKTQRSRKAFHRTVAPNSTPKALSLSAMSARADV